MPCNSDHAGTGIALRVDDLHDAGGRRSDAGGIAAWPASESETFMSLRIVILSKGVGSGTMLARQLRLVVVPAARHPHPRVATGVRLLMKDK